MQLGILLIPLGSAEEEGGMWGEQRRLQGRKGGEKFHE